MRHKVVATDLGRQYIMRLYGLLQWNRVLIPDLPDPIIQFDTTRWSRFFYRNLAHVAKAGRRMDGYPKFPTLDALLLRFIEIRVR